MKSRRPTRKRRHTRGRQQADLEIPDELAASFLAFVRSPCSYCFSLLTVVCAQNATTDGVIVAVGATRELCSTLVANTHRRIVVALPVDIPGTHPKYRRIAARTPVAAMSEILETYTGHIDLLYLGNHVGTVLSMLGHKLKPGSIVCGLEDAMAEFYNWAVQEDRKLYALARSSDPVGFAAMVAN